MGRFKAEAVGRGGLVSRSAGTRLRSLTFRDAVDLVDARLVDARLVDARLIDAGPLVPAFAGLLLAAAEVFAQGLCAPRVPSLLRGRLPGSSEPLRHRNSCDSSLRQRQGRAAAKPWRPDRRSLRVQNLRVQKEPCTGFAQVAHRAPSRGSLAFAGKPFFRLQPKALPSLGNPALP